MSVEKDPWEILNTKREGDRLIARIKALPQRLRNSRALVYAIDERCTPFENMRSYDRRRSRAAAALKGLDETDRAEVFATLFPSLGPAMEAAWQEQGRWPVPVACYDETCRAFRAPSDESLLLRGRAYWFCGVCDVIGGSNPDADRLAHRLPRVFDPQEAAAHVVSVILDGRGPGGRAEGDRCLEALVSHATGTRPNDLPDEGIFAALLGCERPEAWAFVEKMLLAAKRDEGLRQAILERAHAGHPEAFRRILRIVVDERLARFSSVVRAVDAWFGLQWDSISAKHIHDQVELVLRFLTDADARDAATVGDDANAAYLALWAAAFDDLSVARRLADGMLHHQRPEIRFAAAHLLARTDLPHVAPTMRAVLEDDDLRIAACAAAYFTRVDAEEIDRGPAFDALEALHARAGRKPAKLKPIIWPWTEGTFGQRHVGAALVNLGDIESAERLVKYADAMDPMSRAAIARYLGRLRGEDGNEGDPSTPITEGARAALVRFLGDSSKDVREAAFEGLRGRPIKPDEVERLESLLDRKAADLRTSALERLASQDDAAALASARRLVADGKVERRRAGVELLQTLARAQRSLPQVREVAAEIAPKGLDAPLREQVEALTQTDGRAATLGDCLGLLEGLTPTPAPEPVDRGFPVVTPAALRCLLSLDDLIRENRSLPVPKRPDCFDEEVTLGSANGWRLMVEERGGQKHWREHTLFFEDLWRDWERGRGDDLRDKDGLELARAALAMRVLVYSRGNRPKRWPAGFKEALERPDQSLPKNYQQVQVVVEWLMHRAGPPGWIALLIDGAETAVAHGMVEYSWDELEDNTRPELQSPAVEYPFEWFAELLDEWLWGDVADEQYARLWRVYRAVDAWGARVWSPRQHAGKGGALKRSSWGVIDEKRSTSIPRPDACVVLGAMRAGAANEADLIRYMIHAHPGEAWHDRDFTSLQKREWRARLRPPPAAVETIRRVADRIVEVEMRRGDAATETTNPVLSLRDTGGMHAALEAVARLGSLKLARTGFRWGDDRPSVLCGIIMKTSPADGETPAAFAAAAAERAVGDDRLVQLAVYAPQWAAHVEGALGWDGLAEGVWWIHAHTKDSAWRLDSELEEVRKAAIAERTPIDEEDLRDGAVDVDWFHRVFKALGRPRWERLYDAAKYACGGAGHKRAQLFADAMLERTPEAELVERIETKRHQDSVRALGLLPLKKKDRVLARYRVMQELRRTSRKHGGSMLQASEKRAVEIGMENLARTAGYPDPVRLQWAMEAEAVADLARGPVTARAGDVSVTLSIDAEGAPQIDVVKDAKAGKNGKGGSAPRRLASVPAAAKKDAAVAELTGRVKEIRQQASRMRESLEAAMCRGDRFTGRELIELCKHPVLRPMIERLVFIGDGWIGYPEKGGKLLRSCDGSLEPLKPTDELRIAHPHDLLDRGWSNWQRECFAAERVQPFKQVFRELYILTDRERDDALRSTRYAGHQVQPRQAMALLGKRGWVARPEEGVQRTFHAERLTARVEFDEHFFTPAEVEGLTVDAVTFATSGKGEPVKLADVPPRIFSEIMRDLDLAVSVAHRGGVDPEASESTVESRASLLRETCALLGLDNVEIVGPRATIRGGLGDYSVHLGSATVQMMPGGSVWIVPVHAQHRGRIFLPFADDDPKTAEVISKVLLLARDEEIKDPAIRRQIAGR